MKKPKKIRLDRVIRFPYSYKRTTIQTEHGSISVTADDYDTGKKIAEAFAALPPEVWERLPDEAGAPFKRATGKIIVQGVTPDGEEELAYTLFQSTEPHPPQVKLFEPHYDADAPAPPDPTEPDYDWRKLLQQRGVFVGQQVTVDQAHIFYPLASPPPRYVAGVDPGFGDEKSVVVVFDRQENSFVYLDEKRRRPTYQEQVEQFLAMQKAAEEKYPGVRFFGPGHDSRWTPAYELWATDMLNTLSRLRPTILDDYLPYLKKATPNPFK